MRRNLQILLGVSALAAATQVGAQVTVYPNSAPVTVYPNSTPVTVYQSTAPDIASPDQLYQARVISSRPVSGAPVQQCRIERQQVGPLELPGVLITGTVDLLTGKPQSTPYVERCSTVASTAYWDVTYEFRGAMHHGEFATQPGATVTVNGDGVPRG